jgi:hypothetical protein
MFDCYPDYFVRDCKSVGIDPEVYPPTELKDGFYLVEAGEVHLGYDLISVPSCQNPYEYRNSKGVIGAGRTPLEAKADADDYSEKHPYA